MREGTRVEKQERERERDGERGRVSVNRIMRMYVCAYNCCNLNSEREGSGGTRAEARETERARKSE